MQRRSFLGAISCIRALALSASASDAAAAALQASSKPASLDRRVGIAFGGGSLHGMAHVGVLKALTEKGLMFQFIAGTIVGSIVGVLAAAQLSTIESESRHLAGVLRHKWLADRASACGSDYGIFRNLIPVRGEAVPGSK